MKKALMVASVASMIDQFNMENIKLLQKMGYTVHIACNFLEGNTSPNARNIQFKKELEAMNVIFHQIDFSRRGLAISQHISAYKQLKFILEKDFKLIHLHSPIGGAIGRLAARKSREKGTRIIYTAHGFHFYKGAPLTNWLVYYPVERWLARYTDILITINKEDYERAKGFKAKRVEYVPGVGIDIDKINTVEVDKVLKHKELGLPEDPFVLLSVGELNKNKNHEVIIKALASLNNANIHYVICGQGGLKGYLRNLSTELGIENQVHLLGFRKDIAKICKASDVFMFPSKREGLGLAALEAMACGLPIITSNVHGIVDYSVDGETGFVCNPTDVKRFSQHIISLRDNKKLLMRFSRHNVQAAKKYDFNNIIEILSEIY